MYVVRILFRRACLVYNISVQISSCKIEVVSVKQYNFN